jgi:hypothetical protein
MLDWKNINDSAPLCYGDAAHACITGPIPKLETPSLHALFGRRNDGA